MAKSLTKFPSYVSGFLNTREIIKENVRLREGNNSLLGYIAEIENLKRENELLRNELKIAPKLKSRLLMVDIFNIQKSALSSTALINKGEADGVKKSMAVTAGGNILIGVIDEVFENSARALLLDDPRLVISVRVQGTDVVAETRGELRNSFKIDLVTHKEEVEEGVILITSGLDGLKESLLVGRVSKVKSGSGGLFREITGEPLFDLSLGSGVFVILE